MADGIRATGFLFLGADIRRWLLRQSDTDDAKEDGCDKQEAVDPEHFNDLYLVGCADAH